jgi:ABC-type multidrug transport system permease subunit
VLLIVGGAGPPPEVLTGAMGTLGDITPLRHAIRVIQDGWLSLDPGMSWLIVAVTAIVCGLLAIRFFRWE